ncbi:MAG: family 78 glycoside hydrolase catalytic domain, partial [Bacteroidota bacterium]
GWFAGRIGYDRKQWVEKDPPRLLAQLELTLADGSTQTIVTDEQWQCSDQGPLRLSSIYDGEIFDANYQLGAWSSPDYKTNDDWQAVISDALTDSIALVPKRHQLVRNKHTLTTQALTTGARGEAIFDMGQNMVGVPKLRVPMRKGDTLTIRFAEMLQQDGELYTENYRSALSTDYYVAAADGEISYTPQFTFHGYRYVGLSGFDPSATPSADWVESLVQYSDFAEAGTFESSHEKLNQLQSNIKWGLRGNFLDIPTDCPQRDERLGWTGDAQVFAPTSIFLADVHSFWSSWLQSMREEQLPNGGIPFVVPNILNTGVSAGWADAATIIPWELYFRTGDQQLLSENYDMMRRWVGYYEQKAEEGLPNFFSFRDWLQPYAKNDNQHGDTPQKYICSAFCLHSTNLTRRVAQLLGKDDEVQRLTAFYDRIQQQFLNEYFDESGKIKVEGSSQTAYLLALGFGLLPESMRAGATAALLDKITEADEHLRTGFLGTPLLAPVLDEAGRSDLMFSILMKESYPSWFYSINQGATTMWERWNSYSHESGFGNAGMNSFNHYAYGAIGQWMYERIAGIAPLEAGYRKIRIAPLCYGPLTQASATYESPFGQISSSWERTDASLSLNVTIPAGTTAQLELPKKEGQSISINGAAAETVVKEVLGDTPELMTVLVDAGTFEIEMR